MHVYHDVKVKGIDAESSELSRPGNCELVFALNEAPPQEWRELFRRAAHDGAHAALEHAAFRAGFLVVSVPLVNAVHVAETLQSVVSETNGRFRDEYGEMLREQAAFADVVQRIDGIYRGAPAT